MPVRDICPPLATPPAAPGQTVRHRRRVFKLGVMAVATWVCLGTAQPSYAAPDEAPDATRVPAEADPITQLLVDRGVLPPGTPGVVQSMRDKASDLVVSAINFLGVPYRRGGQSADDGFDCSGFTRHIFELSLGMVLPRRAVEQAQSAALQSVPREELKPGDLVFFNTMRRAFSHVGIYVGDGKFIHAPRSGSEVRIEDMRQAYWRARFNGARRAEKLQAPLPQAGPAPDLLPAPSLVPSLEPTLAPTISAAPAVSSTP